MGCAFKFFFIVSNFLLLIEKGDVFVLLFVVQAVGLMPRTLEML
jgi:hypothetical protein